MPQALAVNGHFFALKIFITSFAASILLRLLHSSLRWKVVGLEGSEQYWACKEPRIIVFWHDRQLLMPWLYRIARKKGLSKPMTVLNSQHRDGRIMARLQKFLGIDSIAGSSSRRGREAIFDLIKALKGGSHIAMTPDGPKGPPYELKEGIIRIAQRSGAAIYPTAFSSDKKWNAHSWDRMIFPKPFSRAVFVMGKPILIPPRVTAEELHNYAILVQDALNDLTKKADKYQYGN